MSHEIERDKIINHILSIARSNEDFICTQCLSTCSFLFTMLKNFENPALNVKLAKLSKEFYDITGLDIDIY